jgi:hypothetical protein
MLKQSFSFLLSTPCGKILMNYFFLFFFLFWLNPAYYFEDYALEGRWWKPERLIWKWLIYVGICVWINCIHVIFWSRRIGVWLSVWIDHIYVIFWSRQIWGIVSLCERSTFLPMIFLNCTAYAFEKGSAVWIVQYYLIFGNSIVQCFEHIVYVNFLVSRLNFIPK